MSRNLDHSKRHSPSPELLEQLANDRILSRYISAVGYSSLASVQDCLHYKNQIFKQTGQRIDLTDLLNAGNSIAPTVPMRARGGFRA